MLRYEKLKKSPSTFQRITGLRVGEFECIVKSIRGKWKKEILGSYKRPGRHYKLSLEDMVMMLLVYYRSYITQLFLGELMGIDKSRVCRIMRQLEELLPKGLKLKKEKDLKKEELKAIILDVTEQRIERPKKRQKDYYSGKKKCPTLKTELRISDRGRIIGISKSVPGSMHDYALHKKGKAIMGTCAILGDLGYQGLRKRYKKALLPFKKKKKEKLGEEEKAYNRKHSRLRVRVEHVIMRLKRFRILAERYRNKRSRYNVKFTIISGLINLKYAN